MEYKNTQAFAENADKSDNLSIFRERFFIPGFEGVDSIYLCGNSLGLQPKSALDYIKQELEDWKQFGVEGHFKASKPWFPYHEFLNKQAAEVVGALPHEVVIMNTLTVNLHLMMTTFYRPDKKRFKIIMEGGAFPSDQYAVQSQVKLHGLDPKEAIIELHPRKGEHVLRTEDILEVIENTGASLALVMMGGVNYYTGQAYDMASITKAAHQVGAFAGFDLAHAAGNLKLQLHQWKVDFAVWCGYKYLNSGPGGVSGTYIYEKHARNTQLPRMAGWWGNDPDTRFLMKSTFEAKPTAEGWQLSNAQIMPMALHRAALDIFSEAGMDALRDKSVKLTGYLEYLLNNIIQEHNKPLFQIITPHHPEERGCQLSLQFRIKGKELFQYLTEKGIIADWREPDVIRVAPVPLYNSFKDVFVFASHVAAFYNA